MGLKVSASVVLYKNNFEVCRTIDCLLNSKLEIKIFLVDNSPTNALEELLSSYTSLNEVEYIYNNENLGFGAAHNIAIRKALALSNYHLVVNPDIFFGEDVIERLYYHMESNAEIGSMMPKILYPDNSIQYVAKLIPSPIDLFGRRFLPKVLLKNSNRRFQLEMSGYDKVFEAPYLSGCFMFLRNRALEKVGLFDERFFMYPEDIDLTRRIHKYYKTICYPLVSVYHEHGKGSYKSFKMLWIHSINMIKYFNKWGWVFDTERRQINKKILIQFR